MNGQKRKWLGVIGLLGILVLACVGYLAQGGLLAEVGRGGAVAQTIFWQLRFPRLLAAMAIGAGLAVSGVALQALFRNPLAEPGLIGVSSGAALGAVLALVGLPAVWLGSIGALIWGAVGGFLLGIVTTWVIYLLATRQGRTDASMMLLAGVALNAINGAAVSLVITLSSESELRSIVFWLMGSLSGLNGSQVWVMVVGALGLILGLWRLSRGLNYYLLGESTCWQMGKDPQALKRWVMVMTALFVALAVSQVGVIAFVGLVVPHMMRLLVGTQHQVLIPASALGGALLMVVADGLAQRLMAPMEVPIGLFMALLGGPFFLYLLIRQRAQLTLL